MSTVTITVNMTRRVGDLVVEEIDATVTRTEHDD